MSTIGERIDEARKARGLTKQKLEELCEFSKGYASRLIKDERGTENPTAATLAKLCDKLAVNAAWLERGEGPRDVGAAPPVRTVEREDRYPSRPPPAPAPQAKPGVCCCDGTRSGCATVRRGCCSGHGGVCACR